MPVRPQHELKKCMLVGHANSDLWRSCCTRAVRKKNYLVQLLRMYSTEKLKKTRSLRRQKQKNHAKRDYVAKDFGNVVRPRASGLCVVYV